MLESYAEDERSCSSNSGNTVPWLCQKLPVEASTPVRIDALTPVSVKFRLNQNYAPNYARLHQLIMLYERN